MEPKLGADLNEIQGVQDYITANIYNLGIRVFIGLHSVRMHHLTFVLSKCSLQLQNVASNNIRISKLASLFSKLPLHQVTLCKSNISLDIAPNNVGMYKLSFLFSNFGVIYNTIDIFLSASPNIVTNSVGVYNLAPLLSVFSHQFQLPKHRFQSCQKAPLIVLVFSLSLSSSNFQIIVSKYVRKHGLASFSSSFNFQKLFEIASEASKLICSQHFQTHKSSF